MCNQFSHIAVAAVARDYLFIFRDRIARGTGTRFARKRTLTVCVDSPCARLVGDPVATENVAGTGRDDFGPLTGGEKTETAAYSARVPSRCRRRRVVRARRVAVFRGTVNCTENPGRGRHDGPVSNARETVRRYAAALSRRRVARARTATVPGSDGA